MLLKKSKTLDPKKFTGPDIMETARSVRIPSSKLESRSRASQYPVNLQTFMKYMNYEELLKKYVKKYEHKYPKRLSKWKRQGEDIKRILLEAIFIQFYTNPSKRAKFGLKMKACPFYLKTRLLNYAKIVDENKDSNSSLEPRDVVIPKKQPISNQDSTDDTEFGTEETLEFDVDKQQRMNYTNAFERISETKAIKFPVSLATFKKFMHYEEVLKTYIKNLEANCPKHLEELKAAGEDVPRILVYKIYKQFYTDQAKRQKYAMKMKPCAIQLRARLLQFAKEIDIERKTVRFCQDMGDGAPEKNVEDIPTTKLTDVREKTGDTEDVVSFPETSEGIDTKDDQQIFMLNTNETVLIKFPVSLATFMRCMCYEEYLEKMLQTQERNYPERIRKWRAEGEDIIRLFVETMYVNYFTIPEKREKYALKMRPCTADKRDKLLQYAVGAEWAKDHETVNKKIAQENIHVGQLNDDSTLGPHDNVTVIEIEDTEAAEADFVQKSMEQLRQKFATAALKGGEGNPLKMEPAAAESKEIEGNTHPAGVKTAIGANSKEAQKKSAARRTPYARHTVDITNTDHPSFLPNFMKSSHFDKTFWHNDQSKTSPKLMLEEIYKQFYTKPQKFQNAGYKIEEYRSRLKATLLDSAIQSAAPTKELLMSSVQKAAASNVRKSKATASWPIYVKNGVSRSKTI